MNTDVRQLILDTVERICADHVNRKLIDAVSEGHWPDALWSLLKEVGLVQIGAEAATGQMAWADVYAPLRILGRHAAPVPLAEVLVANHILHEVGHQATQSDLTLSLACAEPGTELKLHQGLLSGRLPSVPFGRHIDRFLVVFQQDDTWCHALLDAKNITHIEQNYGIAGEPSDHLQCRAAPVDVISPQVPEKTWLLLALTRVLLMAGAMESALELSVQYALQRNQFGRPIASFQAIQQQLAMAAGEVAISTKAAEIALAAVDTDLLSTEVAIAKARVGEAAGLVSEICHQVHGAIGFTYEHVLHYRTRRLWAWRDEAGNEAYWQLRLGRHISALGADLCWPFVVQPKPLDA